MGVDVVNAPEETVSGAEWVGYTEPEDVSQGVLDAASEGGGCGAHTE